MGANEKLPATLHPDDDVQPMGENPVLPPFMEWALAVVGPNARSAAAAVFDAIAATDDAIRHARNLQAAVNDIRSYCDGKHTVGAVEIRNLLESHGV